MEHYKIYHGEKEFDASEYQDKIFNTIEHGVGNLIINAAAGSSKSTTIVNAIRFISEKKKILFVAFNKDIVGKIKQEVTHENATVLTFHSLGYYILLENGLIKAYTQDNTDLIDEYKYKNYIKANFNILSVGASNEAIGKRRPQYINNIVKLCDYARYYLSFSLKEIARVVEIYDIIPISNEIEVCREVLLWGKDHIETIDYTDLLWLPNVLNLTTKKYLFNWIFIDEAQDTSIVEQKLIDKCFKRGTRFAAVLDTFQQINVWCGSTLDAIDNFKQYPNTKEYKLPISYRCPKKIVELASKYSDNIVARPNAIEGEIRYNVFRNEAVPGDMVLCRTTAPLVEQFLNFLSIGKKAYIRGSENIKKEYIDLITSTKSNLVDRNCVTSDGVFPKLYVYLFEQMERIKSIGNMTDEEVLSHPSILSLYDNITALKVLADGTYETKDLLEKINIVLDGNVQDGIELSTVHKAKGLEADNVYILQPSLMPSKFAKKEWEIKTENNLIYVAYTRAKKTLNFIKEDDITYRTSGYYDVKKILKEFKYIKEKLKFNSENLITEKNFKTNLIKPEIKKLGEITTNETIITNNKPKKKGLDFRKLL